MAPKEPPLPELTHEALREHYHNLDQCFRGLGQVFKILTYEQGRLQEEEMAKYPDAVKAQLSQVVVAVNKAGQDLRSLAQGLKSQVQDALDEEIKQKAKR